MPSKSRRNRRNIPQNRPVTNNTEPAKQSTYQANTSPVTQPEKTPRPGRNPVVTPIYSNILSEIKWISVVTVVVIAILIVLYYTVR
jgi:hypothetical protein